MFLNSDFLRICGDGSHEFTQPKITTYVSLYMFSIYKNKNIFQMYFEGITSIFKADQLCVKCLRVKQ